MSPEDKKILAQDAKRVLESRAFHEATQVYVTRMAQAWISGGFTSVEQREDAFRRVQAFNLVSRELVAMMETWALEKGDTDPTV